MIARTRVMLADDHAIVLVGLRQLLAGEEDFVVVAEAEDGAQVLNAPLDEIDLLLLDLSLPRFGGIEVLRRVRARHPRLKVVIVSMYAAEHYAARLVAEGASAYLSKNTRSDVLLETLRRVVRGEPPRAEPRADLRPTAPHASLSAREYQVFTLLCEGRKTTEIAVQLDVSPSTVSNYVASIKAKLEVDSIAAIVAYAHRAGIID